MKQGVTLATLTPESLSAFCEEFIFVGSLAKKLEIFSSNVTYDGKVLTGFVSGVRKYLRVYTNSVLSLSRKFDGNLGQLGTIMSPLMKQITFLANLCNVNQVCHVFSIKLVE